MDQVRSFNIPDPYAYESRETLGVSPYGPLELRQGQARDIANDVQENDYTAPDGSRRKKGAASTLANDNELRRLFRENEGKDLKELAAQVLEKRSEKTKQIFGMLWYNSMKPLLPETLRLILKQVVQVLQEV